VLFEAGAPERPRMGKGEDFRWLKSPPRNQRHPRSNSVSFLLPRIKRISRMRPWSLCAGGVTEPRNFPGIASGLGFQGHQAALAVVAEKVAVTLRLFLQVSAAKDQAAAKGRLGEYPAKQAL